MEKPAYIDHPGNQSLLQKTTYLKGFSVDLQSFLLSDFRFFFVLFPFSVDSAPQSHAP
jgi:hypothetical protein